MANSESIVEDENLIEILMDLPSLNEEQYSHLIYLIDAFNDEDYPDGS